jgi:hypothetical protein
MRAAGAELKVEGVVRVMHPEKGMGVEFSQTTPEHKDLLEKFLALLTENRNVLPEMLVEPEGLEMERRGSINSASAYNGEDALLGLFRNDSAFSADWFHAELCKQRGTAAAGASA